MPEGDRDFAGKVVVVTGAGAGFGAGFSRAFAERGATVALLDIDLEAAKAVAQSITARGGRALALHCDVGDDAAVPDTMQRIAAELGGIDILINNAGLHSAKFNKGFADLGVAETRRLFDVNVFGVIKRARLARIAATAKPPLRLGGPFGDVEAALKVARKVAKRQPVAAGMPLKSVLSLSLANIQLAPRISRAGKAFRLRAALQRSRWSADHPTTKPLCRQPLRGRGSGTVPDSLSCRLK